MLLIISSIWQIIKGKKKTGFALLSTALTPIFALGFMVYLFAGTMNKPDEKLASERIEPLIREKTDLTIPNDFEILENLIEHTEVKYSVCIYSNHSMKCNKKPTAGW